MSENLCFPEPQIPDDTLGRSGESMGSFLLRSTWPKSAYFRRFFNGNLAQLAPEVARGICAALHRQDIWPGQLELVTARLCQLLGATGLRYEAKQITGKRPDLEVDFEDGSVLVDAVYPSWDQEFVRESRRNEPLIEIIEREIPKGWGYAVHSLPEIGPADSKGPFRAAVRALFVDLPSPAAGLEFEVGADLPQGRLELALLGGLIDRQRAWLMGPGHGSYGEADKRLRKVLSRKRSQLRGAKVPVLVAIAGGLGETLEDFDIALFGRTRGWLTDQGVVPGGFKPSGLWGRSDIETPIISGVLAFCHLQYTEGTTLCCTCTRASVEDCRAPWSSSRSARSRPPGFARARRASGTSSGNCGARLDSRSLRPLPRTEEPRDDLGDDAIEDPGPLLDFAVNDLDRTTDRATEPSALAHAVVPDGLQYGAWRKVADLGEPGVIGRLGEREVEGVAADDAV